MMTPDLNCRKRNRIARSRIRVVTFGCMLLISTGLGVAATLPERGVLQDEKPSGSDDVTPVIPLGLDPTLPVPADNRLTPEKIALGERLFFDPILSSDRTASCSTCHLPDHGFAGDGALAVGVGNAIGRRNAPTVLNRAYGTSQFWDGRVGSLEEQALLPIESERELASSVEAVLERLSADPEYQREFAAAFPDGITRQNLARALASYERTLLSGNSPADRFFIGEITALSESARRGKWLFESRGQCWRCHSGPNFTDEDFHNTGVSWGREPLDLGRFEITESESDRGGFKTPTVRDVANTAPYMHDGSLATLRDVVEFYNHGGGANPNLDGIVRPLDLSEEDIEGLVAFLEALSAPKDNGGPEGPAVSGSSRGSHDASNTP